MQLFQPHLILQNGYLNFSMNENFCNFQYPKAPKIKFEKFSFRLDVRASVNLELLYLGNVFGSNEKIYFVIVSFRT